MIVEAVRAGAVVGGPNQLWFRSIEIIGQGLSFGYISHPRPAIHICRDRQSEAGKHGWSQIDTDWSVSPNWEVSYQYTWHGSGIDQMIGRPQVVVVIHHAGRRSSECRLPASSMARLESNDEVRSVRSIRAGISITSRLHAAHHFGSGLRIAHPQQSCSELPEDMFRLLTYFYNAV